MYFSRSCVTVAIGKITPVIMACLLDANNGISTSSFAFSDAGMGKSMMTQNNFCKLQDMGPEDEDDVLSCVHFYR